MAPAVTNPHLNVTTGTAARQLTQVGVRLHSARMGTFCHVTTWATRFLETLTNLWVGVVERRWNSERPLVFQACILRRVRGISRVHDVKPIIWG